MLKLLWSRLRRGSATVPFPSAATGLPERFRGRPVLDPARCGPECRTCAAAAPSQFLRIERAGRPEIRRPPAPMAR